MKLRAPPPHPIRPHTQPASMQSLLHRLGALGPLGAHVAETLTVRRSSPLALALRTDRAVAREPTHQEALGLVLAHVSKLANFNDALDLESLARLGEDGAHAAHLVSDA
jgi:hypothetical protein